MVKAAVPTCLSNMLYFMVGLTNIYFMGRFTEDVLMASVGMGNMLINVILMATCLGFNGTIETFVSQSYGANSKLSNYMCGVQFNRGRILLTILFVPIAVILWFSDEILVACGQDEEISRISREYIVWTLPGYFAYVSFDSRKRYL